MVKVSIIVPVYNTEKYLSKCIDSLINQTEKDIEILILNDGSTDGSESIIKSYDDKRITYIKKENTGIGSTRNLGIKKAKGEYLMFIDSDDYIKNNCVEELYNYALKTNSELVISDFYKDLDGKFEIIKIPDFKSSNLNDNPKIINCVNLGPCNKIYKKSLLKNISFEENLKYEDAPFVIKALKNANKVSKLNKPLSYYVIHGNSQTTIRDEKIHDILEISKIIIDELKDDIYHDELVNLIVMIVTDYIIQLRYIKNSNVRNSFIDKAFIMLNKLDSKWNKCEYMMRTTRIKRFIKSHKSLLKIYCFVCSKLKK